MGTHKHKQALKLSVTEPSTTYSFEIEIEIFHSFVGENDLNGFFFVSFRLDTYI